MTSRTLAMLVLLCGCSSTPESEAPRTQPVSTPVEFTEFKAEAPEGSTATRWLPGGPLVVSVAVTNHGEDLTDYPSVVLECSDSTLEIAEAQQILYGLPVGHPYVRTWTVKAHAEAALGTSYTLKVLVYENNMDPRVGTPPLGTATYEIEVGQSLGE